MRTLVTTALAVLAFAAAAHAQNINAPLAQPSPTISTGRPGPVVGTPRGPDVVVGGTRGYQQLSGPNGSGGIMTPNSNGTSTIISPGGGRQVVPTPR
jgi:hypothetical protein